MGKRRMPHDSDVRSQIAFNKSKVHTPTLSMILWGRSELFPPSVILLTRGFASFASRKYQGTFSG